MAMKLLHAALAVLTVLLFLVRQKYVYARVCPVKQRVVDSPRYCSGSSLVPEPRSSGDPLMCTCDVWTSNHSADTQPKYKRDPEISVDNEDIGKHPYD